VHGLQEHKLFHQEIKGSGREKIGNDEVLQHLPQDHKAQRGQEVGQAVTQNQNSKPPFNEGGFLV